MLGETGDRGYYVTKETNSAGAVSALTSMRAMDTATIRSTLRIPLAGRALGDRMFPQMAVHDRYAAATLAAIGDDGSRWTQDCYSMWGVLARTRYIREQAQRFMRDYPKAHFVNIGCGLSQYFQWLDNGTTRMTDADLPEVVALRDRLLPPLNARQQTVTVDLTMDDWWRQLRLPRRQGRPLFLLLEGVSMYLSAGQMRNVLETIGAYAPAGSVLVLDAFSVLATGNAFWHPSLRNTGASIKWGLKRSDELEQAHERFCLIDSMDIMAGYDWANAMCSAGFTFMAGMPFYAMYVLSVE